MFGSRMNVTQKRYGRLRFSFLLIFFSKASFIRISLIRFAGCWSALRKTLLSYVCHIEGYSMLDTLASENQGFYAVLKFMTILLNFLFSKKRPVHYPVLHLQRSIFILTAGGYRRYRNISIYTIKRRSAESVGGHGGYDCRFF